MSRYLTNPLRSRAFFVVVAVAVFSLGYTARGNAAMLTVSFTTPPGMDATLTYLSDPNGAQPAHDSLLANIISPQFGSGTLSVPDDYTNYGTATSHADVATFTFGSGTFFGADDVMINFMNGSAVVTYHITGGTGIFAGYSGTITEAAHFTSLGSFMPNVPATVVIDSAAGTLLAPEPGTVATLALGLLAAFLRKTRRGVRCSRGSHEVLK